MKARDVMTAEPVSVGPDTSTRNIARLLLERGISAVPVVDEGGALARGIRVHAVSPGPLATRAAASGIRDFDELMERVECRAPARRLVTIEEVGAACVFLASAYAGSMTGETLYIDGGYHIPG